MSKTIKEINERIKRGEAVIVTAEEIIDIVAKKGTKEAAKLVDVVTTGTFGPMCSSSVYFNIGHTKPKMKLGGGKATLNGVPAYTGLAAVDIFIGAGAIPDDDPRNIVHPGEFRYGGGHVIEDLVAGKDIKLEAITYGTDCYPRKSLKTLINIKDLNEAVLLNPRNAYQNYNVAVNLSKDRTLYTYMGALKPDLGNANYSSAGQLSPLLNDPYYKTIGIGTRIFLGGGIGYVYWQGTQHNPDVLRTDKGVPKMPAGTLALSGDLKSMNDEYLIGVSYQGYGTSLSVGVGIPIPILDEEMVKFTAVKDEDIYTQIVDYSENYPNGIGASLGEVNYKELKSGKIKLDNRIIPTASLSSYVKAQRIADTLKKWIIDKKFYLTEFVSPIPSCDSGIKVRPLLERPFES